MERNDEDRENNEILIRHSLERCRERLLHDPELDQARPSPEAFAKVRACPTSIECAAAACELYRPRPCLIEWTDVRGATDAGLAIPARTLSYGQLWERIERLAGGLTGVVEAGDRVAICGAGSIAWVVADLTLLYVGATSVPLQPSLSDAEVIAIVAETGARSLFCGRSELRRMAPLLNRCPSLRHVILLDDAGGDAAGTGKLDVTLPPAVTLAEMSTFEAQGAQRPRPMHKAPVAQLPVRTIIYTSGTTGTPKGALFPEALWVKHWRGGIFSQTLAEIPQINLSFMPLNHAMGRAQIIAALVRGGSTHFTRRSDMSTLFDDIRLVRPTLLAIVPRVAEMIYQEFEHRVARRAWDLGLAGQERSSVEADIATEMGRGFLGDRLFALSHGSAPTAPKTVAFLKRCFGVPVFEGYGTTEAGLLTFSGRVVRDSVIDYRLVDRPDLGYQTSDQPHPRGELRVKTHYAIPGYLNGAGGPDGELFDGEGFMRTGDIVEQRGPEQLEWIDRAGSILKLAQGEFVSVSRLEALYVAHSALIRQIYVHGEGSRSFVLAVVVPDHDSVAAHLAGKGRDSGAKQIKEALSEELRRVAGELHLHGYEVPRDILVEPQPFTSAGRLLTETHKLSRPRLRERYGPALADLYAQLEQEQQRRFEDIAADRTATPGGRTEQLVAASLGLDLAHLRQMGGSFPELGGDSLAAVRLVALVRDACGVDLPLATVMGSAEALTDIVDYVEQHGLGAQDSGRTPWLQA
jgi:fatty acid CoA ligase FadD9